MGNIRNEKILSELCPGCSLCANSCPREAIEMRSDKEGFLFPEIDSDLCVDCGKCLLDCPQIGRKELRDVNVKSVYACQAKSKEILIEATAGALFPVLASFVIGRGGVVYGAVYNDEMNVVHVAITKGEDINRMNGSKYVQSDIKNSISEARQNLIMGKTVLFSGTPCQIDALNRICRDIDRSHLFTIDVVCYGIPSPKLFHSYLSVLENKYQSKVRDFRFRDKHTYGWSHTTVIKMECRNGDLKVIEEPDYRKIPYFKMFAYRDCFRKSCYHCMYTSLHRISDITTGNFWGIEKISVGFDSKQGVSMALLNTDKGIQLFNEIKSQMIIEKRSLEDAVKANNALLEKCPYPKHRDDIYHNFIKHGFEFVEKKYYRETILFKAKHEVKTILKKVIRILPK